MTLSDDVKTQLDTMASHPTLYLRKANNGESETSCFVVDHGVSEELPADCKASTHKVTTPFTVYIKATTEAARDTYVTDAKASIRAKAVTGGYWEVVNTDAPEVANVDVAADALLTCQEVKWV